jgi:hypothetical protein
MALHEKTLLVYQRVEAGYERCDASSIFPCLPIAEIPDFIEQSHTIGQRSTVRLFRQRIREILESLKD